MRGSRPKTPFKERFESKLCPEPMTGCLLWTAAGDKNGYGLIHDGEHKQVKAHRAAWTFEHGPIPDGMCVLHKCDTPECCNVQHLFLGTNQENTADKMAKGRHRVVRGEDHPSSKLTLKKVEEIRRRAADGENHRTIAADFGIRRQHVGRLVRHERWAS
jgi:hypothetical protein